MERIWAPWRMEYIENPDGGDAPGGCIFCDFPPKQEDDKYFIFLRREKCFGMLNRYPYNNGHLLIAPYQHESSLLGLPVEVLTDIMTAVRDCVQALTDIMNPHGFNVGLNLGTAAGAGIAGHIHWHIVPRWNGDTNFMSSISDTKVIPQALSRTYELLCGKFGKK